MDAEARGPYGQQKIAVALIVSSLVIGGALVLATATVIVSVMAGEVNLRLPVFAVMDAVKLAL